MPEFSVLGSKSHLPRPGNPEFLELGRDRWSSAITRLEDQSVESASPGIRGHSRRREPFGWNIQP